MIRRRQRLGQGVVFAALLSLSPAALCRDGVDGLSSPAGKARPWAAAPYREAEAPAKPRGGALSEREVSETVSLEFEPLVGPERRAKVTVVVNDAAEPRGPALEVVRLGTENGHWHADADRSVGVGWVGVAAPLTRAPREDEVRFYKAGETLEPLDDDAFFDLGLDLVKWRGAEGYATPAIDVKIGLDTEGYDGAQWRLRGFYDRRTKVEVSRSRYGPSSRPPVVFGGTFHCLHPVELRAVVDVFHGPSQRKEVILADGAKARFEGLTLEVLKVVKGVIVETSVREEDGVRRKEYGFEDMGKDRTVVVYKLDPAPLAEAVSVRALGRDGSELPVAGGNRLEGVGSFSVRAKSYDVGSIEVEYRTGAKRLLVDLPELPSPVEANAGVTDLLDCELPGGRVHADVMVYNLLESVAQLKNATSGWTDATTTGFLRQDVTGMTVRDVLRALAGARGDGVVTVDTKALTFEIDDPAWKRAEGEGKITRDGVFSCD